MQRSRVTIDDRLNAFCKDSDAYLAGEAGGPLAGLTFAAKDIFDVAGHVTGGGNPDWKRTHGPAERTAWVIRVLVEAGATMAGKRLPVRSKERPKSRPHTPMTSTACEPS